MIPLQELENFQQYYLLKIQSFPQFGPAPLRLLSNQASESQYQHVSRGAVQASSYPAQENPECLQHE